MATLTVKIDSMSKKILLLYNVINSMMYMKTKIILTTICSFLFLFGCGNDDDYIVDDEVIIDNEVVIEEKNLVFDSNEKTSLGNHVGFKCENTDSWYISSISEIVVGDTIKKEIDEIGERVVSDWYIMYKTIHGYLSISFNSNFTGKERKLIINISSDSLYNDEILTAIDPTLPDFSIEDENEKKKLTGHIWQRWIYHNNNGGFVLEPFEFLENGIIRVYYSYPDKENNYRDESEYKITGDYFFREDFFVNDDSSGLMCNYFFLKRRLYTYKFLDDIFEIKIEYGLIQSYDTFTYMIID